MADVQGDIWVLYADQAFKTPVSAVKCARVILSA